MSSSKERNGRKATKKRAHSSPKRTKASSRSKSKSPTRISPTGVVQVHSTWKKDAHGQPVWVSKLKQQQWDRNDAMKYFKNRQARGTEFKPVPKKDTKAYNERMARMQRNDSIVEDEDA